MGMGTNQPSAKKLLCSSRGRCARPHQCSGYGQSPIQPHFCLSCLVRRSPERLSQERVSVFRQLFNSRGTASLILLTGMIIFLHLLHSFGGALCLRLGRCVAEDRPHGEDFSPTDSEELVSRMRSKGWEFLHGHPGAQIR